MDADGADLRALSFHDTNEWFPAVSNTGLVLYSRWDYIDRDAVTHQNLWSMRPDGTNPLPSGATPRRPDCSLPGAADPGRQVSSSRSAHHSITAGSIVVVDPRRRPRRPAGPDAADAGGPFSGSGEAGRPGILPVALAAVGKVFPGGLQSAALARKPAANPANALGLYVLDAFGNREFLYRDPEDQLHQSRPLVAAAGAADRDRQPAGRRGPGGAGRRRCC